MRKILSSVAVAVLAATQAFGSVNIDATNFPDATFRGYVSQNFDENSDGILSDAEIAKAKTVDMYGKGTVNLKGIENLTSLRYLACSYSLGSPSNRKFNFTDFKSAYGLDCDIDDSWPLMIDIQVGDDTGLMTPLIGDIKDTSSGKYILNLPTYLNQDVNSIAFKTRGAMNTEVHVLP